MGMYTGICQVKGIRSMDNDKAEEKKLHIGCHLSSSAGYLAMGRKAVQLGADTFQFFTRNPRGGAAKQIDPEDADALMTFLRENDFGKIVAHAPYTLNPCSDRAEIRAFAHSIMADDLMRMEYTPGQYYNFHPGSHVGQGTEQGTAYIISLLNEIIKPEMHTTVLLETMSGKGSEIGSTFEELREIIDGTRYPDSLGVCLDTCHVYSAGYDIAGHLDDVLDRFDSVIGIGRLKAVHLNDSMTPFGSHKDRHEKIGHGTIGYEALLAVTRHPALRGLPFILETPNDEEGYRQEIKLLRGNAQ
jgi:deoxyribonuclease-4